MAGTDPAATLICDAGPLIHLDELGALSLLSDSRVLVPPAVWREVTRHRPSALAGREIKLSQESPSGEFLGRVHPLAKAFSLDAGEREAIQMACQHSESLLITDDAAARLVAEELGLRVHGTIGILVRSIRRKQRSPREVVSLLEQIPTRSSLHIRPSLLREIVAELNNTFLK